jgi:serine/threonine-protein kinase
LLQLGRCKEALESANRHIALSKAPSTIRTTVLARCGTREEARAAFEAFEKVRPNANPNAQMAIVYTALGERERALRELEDAVAFPAAPMLLIKVNPAFDPLRGEPRFQTVLKRIGLGE